QTDRFGAVGLQRFDHALAPEQRHCLLLELLDLVDLFVQLRDLGVEILVASVLGLDPLGEKAVHQDHRADAHADRGRRHHEELALLRFAPYLSVRQSVDWEHASNLRMASPVATTSAGASCCSWRCLILGDTPMLA